MQRNDIKTLSDLFIYVTENNGQPVFSYLKNDKLTEVTRLQFKEDVLRMANAICSLSKAKRIAIIGENSYRYLVAFFAIIIAGKTPVMLDKNLDRDTLLQVMKIAETTHIVHSYDYKDLALSFGMDHCCIDDICSKDNGCLETIFETSPEDMIVIFHTSSSTGFPKVVPLTNRNIISELQALDECTKFEGTAMFCLPAYHVYGMIANVLYFLYVGMKTFISTSPRYLLNELKRVRPTLLSVVPMMYSMLQRAMKNEQNIETLRKVTGGNLKYICFGGAAFTIDPTIILNAGIQINIGYGLTETSSSITMRIINKPNSDPDNVGKAMHGVDIKIGENNELLVKGNMICSNYLNNDSEIQSAFKQGWFKTGDTGYLDANGEVHITGRIKNLIILPNGENVPAEKLEALLYDLPYIDECIVKEHDGKITAFIYCQQLDYAKQHIKDDLSKINSTLPLSHNIAAVEFKDTSFEKTSTQKIKRI